MRATSVRHELGPPRLPTNFSVPLTFRILCFILHCATSKTSASPGVFWGAGSRQNSLCAHADFLSHLRGVWSKHKFLETQRPIGPLSDLLCFSLSTPVQALRRIGLAAKRSFHLQRMLLVTTVHWSGSLRELALNKNSTNTTV